MDPSLEAITTAISAGGGGIAAIVLAVWLAIKAVDLVKTRTNGSANPGGKGNGSTNLKDHLRMICPLGTGRHTLDDVHDVLENVAGGIDTLNTKQDADAAATGKLTDAITALRLEIARGNGRGRSQ